MNINRSIIQPLRPERSAANPWMPFVLDFGNAVVKSFAGQTLSYLGYFGFYEPVRRVRIKYVRWDGHVLDATTGVYVERTIYSQWLRIQNILPTSIAGLEKVQPIAGDIGRNITRVTFPAGFNSSNIEMDYLAGAGVNGFVVEHYLSLAQAFANMKAQCWGTIEGEYLI